jgi:ATP-dependent helicase HrpA
MRHEAAGVTTELFPKQFALRGRTGAETVLALTYHFEPGSPRDGVTLTVPVVALNQVEAVRTEWLVRGMLKEKVHLLLKSLPQKLRRHLVPVPEYAAGFVERIGERVAATPLVDALIADIRAERSLVAQPADFKLETLPAHLLMNFKVVDEHGRQLGMGRNLAQLRAELGAQAQKNFQQLAHKDAEVAEGLADEITDWDFGELPELLEIRRGGQSLVGYPALVDHGAYCSVEVFDEPGEALGQHREGLRRLFRLQLKEQVRYLEKSLSTLQTTQIQAATVPTLAHAWDGFEDLRDQVVTAALDRTCLSEPWPKDRAGFVARKDEARGRLTLIAQEIARLLATIVQEVAPIARRLNGLKAFAAVVADVEQQLGRLFARRFIVATPAGSLAQYPRYLKAIAARLDKLKTDPGRDAARMSEVATLQTPYLRELAARKGVADARLDEFRWLLEELRVSLFAQELRTPMPVSVKRLQKVWDSVSR